MCLWVDTHCVDMHVEARGRDLEAPSLFALKTRLFIESETHWLWSGCPKSCRPLPPPSMGLHTTLDVHVWDLNSGFLASMARALPVKPSPQPRTFPNIPIGPMQSHGQDSSHQMAQSWRQRELLIPILPTLPPQGLSPPYHLRSEQSPWALPTHPTSLSVMTVWLSDSVCPRLKDLPLKATQLLAFLGVPSPKGPPCQHSTEMLAHPCRLWQCL